MSVDVFYVIVIQESFWNVLDQFYEIFDGKLLILDYVEVSWLNDEGLEFELALVNY